MKNYICLILIFLSLSSAYSQVSVKPRIMVVPSDQIMNKKGYVNNNLINNKYYYSFDYSKMFLVDTELKLAISKIGELFSDRGYDLNDLENGLRMINNDASIEKTYEGRNGEILIKSNLDNVIESTNTDVRLDLTFEIVEETGPYKSLTFNIQAIDTYTNKQIAAASGISERTSESNMLRILEQSVLKHIPNLQSQIENYFLKLQQYGRDLAVKIIISNSSSLRLDSDVNKGDYLSDVIEDWISENSKDNNYNLVKDTGYEMEFNPVKVAIYDSNGKKNSTRNFLRDLEKYLKTNFQLNTNRFTVGIGKGYLIIN